MNDIVDAFFLALWLIAGADADLLEIVGLSLFVSVSATAAAALIGLPLGAALAIGRFRGRRAAVVAVNALMGLPPVVVGLLVYLYLSRSGPLGWLGLLYTPTAMIIAQTILVAPIIAALSRQILAERHAEYDEQLRSLSASPGEAALTLLWDARGPLTTVALAGFGRAVAEVGAVILVGGNIDHATRVMTTAIALETSKGALPMALALGMILLAIALSVNILAASAVAGDLRRRGERDAHA